MTSVIRRPMPLLPDVFGWLESSWPFMTNSVRVEEFTEDGKYVVRAELPGFDPEKDIDVSAEHGQLVLTAERRQQEHGRGHSEFHYGAFSRTLPLPAGARAKDISARYVDGILEVTMPAPDTTEAKPIHIEIGTEK